MLVYIDESGHPHPNDSTTRPVLVALCLKEDAHRRVMASLYRYKRDLVGHDLELKGTQLLRPRIFEKRPRERELVERVFDLIAITDLHIFGVIMHRPVRQPELEQGQLPWQQRRLLERIDCYVEEFGERGEKAIIVYDGLGMGGVPGGLAPGITGYLCRHPSGKALTRIVITPMFVDSSVTPGVQLADMVASCIRQYTEKELYRKSPGGDPFLSALGRYYKTVEDKTLDLVSPSGMTLYGLLRMSERYFYSPDEPEDATSDE